MGQEKPFELIWISQNEVVTIKCGEYASIPEAAGDLPRAKAQLNAQYPASDDPHYPHDIQAGTFRVVPRQPA